MLLVLYQPDLVTAVRTVSIPTIHTTTNLVGLLVLIGDKNTATIQLLYVRTVE